MPVPSALEPLRASPQTSALFLDFDGTLSPIVADPALARPLDGVPSLFSELGVRLGVVAVVSGRPAAFLGEHLGRPTGVRLIGLYGLEEVGEPAGPTVDPGSLTRWRPVMADLADVAERGAPAGVSVERKPLGFTLHFRDAPAEEGWATRFADEQRERTGLVDLAAFDALAELGAAGMPVVRVAVTDDESPAAVAEAADVIVIGPGGALELLVALVAAIPG